MAESVEESPQHARGEGLRPGVHLGLQISLCGRGALGGGRASPARRDRRSRRTLVWIERRALSKILTLTYTNVVYQIRTKRAAYTMRGAYVEVRETGAGGLTIEY